MVESERIPKRSFRDWMGIWSLFDEMRNTTRHFNLRTFASSPGQSGADCPGDQIGAQDTPLFGNPGQPAKIGTVGCAGRPSRMDTGWQVSTPTCQPVSFKSLI